MKPFLFYRSSSVAWELRDDINTWISLWDTVLHWEESRAIPEGSWTLREQRWQAAHPKPKACIPISHAAETLGGIFQRPECDTKVGKMASELHQICTNTPGNNGKTPLGSPGRNRRHSQRSQLLGKAAPVENLKRWRKSEGSQGCPATHQAPNGKKRERKISFPKQIEWKEGGWDQ